MSPRDARSGGLKKCSWRTKIRHHRERESIPLRYSKQRCFIFKDSPSKKIGTSRSCRRSCPTQVVLLFPLRRPLGKLSGSGWKVARVPVRTELSPTKFSGVRVQPKLSVGNFPGSYILSPRGSNTVSAQWSFSSIKCLSHIISSRLEYAQRPKIVRGPFPTEVVR